MRQRGLVGLGAFGAEEHGVPNLLPFETKEYGGFRYRTLPEREAGLATWWLSSFMVRKVEQRGNALVATAEYDITAPQPLGQRKSVLSWEDQQRAQLGHGTIIVPMPNWDGSTPLHVVPGTIEVWSTRDLALASSVADPDKPGFAFVIKEPRDGWKVGQEARITVGPRSPGATPYIVAAVGIVAAAGTVYWLATRKN